MFLSVLYLYCIAYLGVMGLVPAIENKLKSNNNNNNNAEMTSVLIQCARNSNSFQYCFQKCLGRLKAVVHVLSICRNM